jgi:hypothetical protein
MKKIVKNVFKTYGSGVLGMDALKELVAQCTLDGSTVYRIKRNYHSCRSLGPDNITIIWTKKEEEK